jgi:hypothetical protein
MLTPVRPSCPKMPGNLPTRAKKWADLKDEWLFRALLALDPEWASLPAQSVEVSRPVLEAVLEHAVGISQDSVLTDRSAEVCFNKLREIYQRNGQPLKGRSIADFLLKMAKPVSQTSQAALASQAGPCQGIFFQATLPGQTYIPLIVRDPDGHLLLSCGQTSVYLPETYVQDWELASSKTGWLVFSQSKGYAKTVTEVLAEGGAAALTACEFNTPPPKPPSSEQSW